MPRLAAIWMSTSARIALTPGAQLAHQPRVRPAHRRDDAELGRTGRGRLLRRLHQRRDVQPHRPHRRGEQPGLRAEVAILRAAAGLQRDDALDLDLRAAPAHPHLVGELQGRRQVLVGQPQHLQDAGLVEADTVGQHLGARAVEDLWHGRTLQNCSSTPKGAVGGAHRPAGRTRSSAGAHAAGQGRARPPAAAAASRRPGRRPGRQRLPGPVAPPRGDRRGGLRPAWRTGWAPPVPGWCAAPPTCTPTLESALAGWLRRRVGAGLLLRLPGQPGRGPGARAAQHRCWSPTRTTTPRSSTAAGISGAETVVVAARRPGGRRRGARRARRPPRGGAHRVGLLGRRRPRAAGRAARGGPPARRAAAGRRRARARRARARRAPAGWPRPAWPASRTWW